MSAPCLLLGTWTAVTEAATRRKVTRDLRFPEGGMSPAAIDTALRAMRSDDADWRAGRTWSLVYSAGAEHEAVLKDAYLQFFSENGSAPPPFRVSPRWSARLSGRCSTSSAPIPPAVGARSHPAEPRASFWPSRPTATPAESIHRRWWSLRPPIRPSSRPGAPAGEADRDSGRRRPGRDVEATAAAIDESTILLGASAPAFPYGLVDPIPQLAALAVERGVGLHVDACLGVFVLPFLRALGYPVPAFDFSVAGVTSISATLATNSEFVGNILATDSVTANNGAIVHGRALAAGAAVSLNVNTFTAPTCAVTAATTTLPAASSTTAVGATTTVAASTPTAAGATTTAAAAPSSAPVTTTTLPFGAPTTTDPSTASTTSAGRGGESTAPSGDENGAGGVAGAPITGGDPPPPTSSLPQVVFLVGLSGAAAAAAMVRNRVRVRS